MRHLIALVVMLIIGGIAAYYFYEIGRSVTDKLNITKRDEKLKFHQKFWISEATQAIIFIGLICIIIFINKFMH